MSPRTGTLAWIGPILAADTLDATDTLLLLGLADHVNEHDECYVGMRNLARYARCSYGTARRRLAELEARGIVSRTVRWRDDGGQSVYHYRIHRDAVVAARTPAEPVTPPRTVSRGVRASGSAVPPARQGARAEVPREKCPEGTPLAADAEEVTDLFGDAVPEPTAVELVKAESIRVTKAVFERRHPRPSTPFPGLQSIARRLLEAGHDPEAVISAMVEDGAHTVAAIEHRLGRARERAGVAVRSGPHLSKSTTSLASWADRHREHAPRPAIGGGR